MIRIYSLLYSIPLGLLLFIGVAISANGQVSNENEIIQLIAAYQDARESKDTTRLKGLFVKDADQLVSSGTWRRGLDELLPGMLRSSGRNPGTRTITVENVRFISDSSAIADARYEITGTNGRPDRKMWSTFVLVKSEESWRIAAIRNMLPAG